MPRAERQTPFGFVCRQSLQKIWCSSCAPLSSPAAKWSGCAAARGSAIRRKRFGRRLFQADMVFDLQQQRFDRNPRASGHRNRGRFDKESRRRRRRLHRFRLHAGAAASASTRRAWLPRTPGRQPPARTRSGRRPSATFPSAGLLFGPLQRTAPAKSEVLENARARFSARAVPDKMSVTDRQALTLSSDCDMIHPQNWWLAASSRPSPARPWVWPWVSPPPLCWRVRAAHTSIPGIT